MEVLSLGHSGQVTTDREEDEWEGTRLNFQEVQKGVSGRKYKCVLSGET